MQRLKPVGEVILSVLQEQSIQLVPSFLPKAVQRLGSAMMRLILIARQQEVVVLCKVVEKVVESTILVVKYISVRISIVLMVANISKVRKIAWGGGRIKTVSGLQRRMIDFMFLLVE